MTNEELERRLEEALKPLPKKEIKKNTDKKKHSIRVTIPIRKPKNKD